MLHRLPLCRLRHMISLQGMPRVMSASGEGDGVICQRRSPALRARHDRPTSPLPRGAARR